MSLKDKISKIEDYLSSDDLTESSELKRDRELTDAEIITYLLIEEDNENPYL